MKSLRTLFSHTFTQCGDIGVLSKDEETDLARKIEEGNRIIRESVQSFPLYGKLLKEVSYRAAADDESSSDEDTVDTALRKTIAALDHAMSGLSVPKDNIRKRERLASED